MPTFTTRDGHQLYYKDWGTGRPVVMLHGWPLSSDSFDDLALAVADAGLRAIAYDRRGFGRSDQPWHGYDYDTLADDLADLLEATDADDVTLLGFSMGGGEVARYLTRHGRSRVRQAVLVGAVVPYMRKTDDNPEGVPDDVFDEMRVSLQADRAKFLRGFFGDFYGVGLLAQPVSDDVIAWSTAVALQAGLKPTLACAEAFATTDFRPDMASFTMPTLILHGTSDRTVPIETSARRAAEAIPGSVLLEYDGAPHGLLASHKAQLARDVLTFATGGDPRVAVPVEPVAATLPYPLDPSVA